MRRNLIVLKKQNKKPKFIFQQTVFNKRQTVNYSELGKKLSIKKKFKGSLRPQILNFQNFMVPFLHLWCKTFATMW